MKILIFGISGMLGSAIYKHLSSFKKYETFGTIRKINNNLKNKNILSEVYAENSDSLKVPFVNFKPDIVINCIGLVKQLLLSKDEISCIKLNTILPNKLSILCQEFNCRLIHFSTDCVFSGEKGNYDEKDLPDPIDLYGLSKLCGEVNRDNCLTLRTSIIGRELKNKSGLLEWFLNQNQSIYGFRNAIFSGLPTNEVSNVIEKYILHNNNLKGICNLSSKPISKYDLLCLIKKKYSKNIRIIPSDDFVIDRSLDSSLFSNQTGYVSKSWPKLVEEMYNFNL